MIEVLTLPNWSKENTYQSSLARALASEGFASVYPAGYRRGLPLARAGYPNARLIHLHWPEAYFDRGGRWDPLRRLRFCLDIKLAALRRPLVYTAHNLLPHNRVADAVTRRNYRYLLSISSAVVVHSAAAAQELRAFSPTTGPIHVIPHGDLADSFPALITRDEARRQLGLASDEPLVLMFGRAEPYKGLTEIVSAWDRLNPTARLWVAGVPFDAAFAQTLADAAAGHPRITLELQWQSPEQLALRLAAADAVLFNYHRIFTSGAACLARSLGCKIVLPARLDTIDLMEPSSTVFRFGQAGDDLAISLAQAIAAPADPVGTARWRAQTSWQIVGRKTAAVYRSVLNDPAPVSRISPAPDGARSTN